MPDISLCIGNQCSIKEKCYRYTAKPDEYGQAYFSVPPYKDKEENKHKDVYCEYFWDIKFREY